MTITDLKQKIKEEWKEIKDEWNNLSTEENDTEEDSQRSIPMKSLYMDFLFVNINKFQHLKIRE